MNKYIGTSYIAYHTEMKHFKTKTGWTPKWDKARRFTMKHHVLSSVGPSAVEDGTIIVVPIEMSIPEEVLVILKLGGTMSDIEDLSA